jgi:CCR4-NOT transcription complex subunit 2
MWHVQVPKCYMHKAIPRLLPGQFTKFHIETLFYIFYSMPGDEAQVFAADELVYRGWTFHKEFKVTELHHPSSGPGQLCFI